jgi:N utilization substance protein B
VTSRREARRTAVFLLYQYDVTGQPLASLFEGEVDPYARDLAENALEAASDLDARLSAASTGWPADRLGALERNVMRVALVELDRGEPPKEVVLDEAVRLAKRYSSEEAGRLVNGILGRIAREAA